MEQNTTPRSHKEEKNKVVAPSNQTLIFLKSFAHSYYVNDSLPKQLKNICVN